MHTRIGVDQDAFGGESLGAVAGDCVTVIEVAMLSRIEFDASVVIESRGNATVVRN